MVNQEISFNENPENEIIASLNSGNFVHAFTLSEQWLVSIPLEESNSVAQQFAEQAFLLTRYLLNKQERLNLIQDYREKANFAKEILSELIKINHESESKSGSKVHDSQIWQTIHFILHSLIANSLARILSGQKAYKLDHDEIIQLAISLIFTGNWKAAQDALTFLLNLNHRHALGHLLQSYVCYSLKDEVNFFIELREALFIQPDVLHKNWQFLPGGIFKYLWQEVSNLNLGSLRSYREYALLLELNGVFKLKRELSLPQFEALNFEFKTLYRNYVENGEKNEEMRPRLLHILCWLIDYIMLKKDYDMLEEYRDIMIELDNESWQLYNSNNNLP